MVADIERPFSESLIPPLDTEIAFWVPSFSYIFCSKPLLSELISDFNGAAGNNVMIIKVSEKNAEHDMNIVLPWIVFAKCFNRKEHFEHTMISSKIFLQNHTETKHLGTGKWQDWTFCECS